MFNICKESGSKAVNIFPQQLSKRHNIKIYTHLTSTVMFWQEK